MRDKLGVHTPEEALRKLAEMDELTATGTEQEPLAEAAEEQVVSERPIGEAEVTAAT